MRAWIRFDPFEYLMHLHRAVNRLFEERVARPGWWTFSGSTLPGVQVDLYERGDGYEIRALVPDLKPEDLELTTDERTVTLRGRLPQPLSEEEARQVTWQVREIGSGAFERSITLPKSFQADQMRASLEDGVVRIWVPLTPEAQHKRIPIQAGKTPHLVSGQTVEADPPSHQS